MRIVRLKMNLAINLLFSYFVAETTNRNVRLQYINSTLRKSPISEITRKKNQIWEKLRIENWEKKPEV